MKTVGIIAEYNPFHNGHKYQLKQAKALSGADYAVVVLSGDFIQRGAPALVSKYARCEMALTGGADLVLELPVCFSLGSAEYFARGAVTLLDSLGVDALCFGSECGNLSSLKLAADILHGEPDEFKKLLLGHQRDGMSFPAARSLALSEYIQNTAEGTGTVAGSSIDELLKSPNNILGIEYIKALLVRNSAMETHTLLRQGSGYLDTALPSDSFCSALAVRQAIEQGMPLSSLVPYLPESTLQILERELKLGFPVTVEDFSSMLFYRLLSLRSQGYTSYADVSPALSDKIRNALEEYTSFSHFCKNILKSKDLTYSRISRALFHILLGITEEFLQEAACLETACYARILGFRTSSDGLLSKLSAGSTPLLSKLADAEDRLTPLGREMFAQDVFASHLYEGIAAQKTGRTPEHEYRRQILRLP